MFIEWILFWKFLYFIIIFCIIFIQFSICDENNNGWCTKIIPEIRTKNVLKTKIEIETQRGWFKTHYYPKQVEYLDVEAEKFYNTIKVCCPGYELSESHNEDDYDDNKICKPICNNCPDKSICTAPNECTCNLDGYHRNIITERNRYCEPICSNKCPLNSECFLPEKCKCIPGYTADNGECLPNCSKGCPLNSKCILPDKCECIDGYQQIKNNFNESIICEPFCSKNCTNGFCFAPNLCVCNAGYLMGKNMLCEPVCSLGCINGKCIEPEICECLNGYQMKENSVNECQPICEPKCINSDCIGPNLCICWQNYEPIHNYDYNLNNNNNSLEIINHITNCTPTCPDGCLHGYCNEPSKCLCNSGYHPHAYIPNECVPTCDNCNFGDCIEPEKCLCWPGYEKKINGCYLIEILTTKNSLELSTLTSTSTSTDKYLTEITNDLSSDIIFIDSITDTTMEIDKNNQSCWDNCNCWTLNSSTSLSSSSCIAECNLDSIKNETKTENCISLNFCYCLEDNLNLKCFHNNNSDSNNNNDDEFYLYNCQSLSDLLVKQQIEFHQKNQNNQEYQNKTKNFIVFFSCALGTMIAFATFVIIYYKFFNSASYNTNNSNGFLVQYEK